MKQLEFMSILELTANTPGVISFIGGGGKTTFISQMASELTAAGYKVLITTTTKFYPFPGLPLFTSENESTEMIKLTNHFHNNNIAVYGRKLNEENKVEGIAASEVQRITDGLRTIILVEADGSKGLPVKGYNPDEPVIPACTELVIAVAGAEALNKRLTSKTVHRPYQLAAAIKSRTGSLLNEERMARVFGNMLEKAREQAPGAETLCILNKVDLLKQEETGLLKIAKALSGQRNRSRYFLGTEAKSLEPVKIVITLGQKKPLPAVSAVVMAAGSASRMGKDKLSLPCGQHTILGKTLDNVKKAGINEVIVVVKPGSEWIKKLNNYGYIIVENHDHAEGQSSSLKAGLMAVSNWTQGVLFVLGDQPSVTPSLYKKLTDSYKSSFQLATAPVYKGKRGNPTLFDRRLWPELLKLTGDEGGRSLFKKLDNHQVEYIETEEIAILKDIDTPDDYDQLLQDGT
ncbi:MAG: molybdenum cofactor cytidylyltransferase [Bacillota bacterium]